MKTFRRMFCVALIAIFLCASALPAFAATTKTFYLAGKGVTNYESIYLEDLQKTDKITSPKSSNKKIFTVYSLSDSVTDSTSYDPDDDDSGYHSGWIGIKLLKKGSANLTYKLNGKTQKVPIKVLAYTNPVKSFVITGLGNTNLKSKFAKKNYVTAKSKAAKAGLAKVTAASGWKINYVSFRDVKADNEYEISSWGGAVTSMQLNIPAMKKGREYYFYMSFENIKTGGTIFVNYQLTK